MIKHKTIIIFENTDSQMTFDGDIIPEDMVNVNLIKEVVEVVDSYVVHSYTAIPIEHDRSKNEGISGKIL